MEPAATRASSFSARGFRERRGGFVQARGMSRRWLPPLVALISSCTIPPVPPTPPASTSASDGDPAGGATYGGPFPLHGSSAPERVPASCAASGVPLFEIAIQIDGAKLASSTKRLYSTGAWTYAETDARGTMLARHGCVSGARVGLVRADLGAASWTLAHHQIHCMAVSPKHTVYSFQGKVVYDARLCTGDELDDKSQRLLDEAIAAVNEAMASSLP
jgi:hypothetical protein